MTKILISSAVAVLLLTGCGEDKKVTTEVSKVIVPFKAVMFDQFVPARMGTSTVVADVEVKRMLSALISRGGNWAFEFSDNKNVNTTNKDNLMILNFMWKNKSINFFDDC